MKPGKKKSKKDQTAVEASTPRTRAALAREEAAKAKREAEEAQAKAAVTLEIAEAASREARNISEPLAIIPSHIELAPPSTPTRTRRYNL